MYHRTKLKNGITLYIAPSPSTATVTVLVLVRAGSKYETKRTNGLSHFLEHMFFKGTTTHPTSREVTEVLDRVGGEYNAFTDKERTGYYAKVDAKHLKLALHWVSDILLHSLMDRQEIEREKGVIQQELSMYYDTPMSHIEDVFEMLLYGDQPAGWDIGGTKETVANVTRADLINYLNKRYLANETMVVVAGNVKPFEVKKLTEKYFKEAKRGKAPSKKRVQEKQTRPAFKLQSKDTDQSHLELGVRTFSAFDKRRHALTILAIILGGNMSSRLFISLRERAGLAYYVSTRPHHYTDTGYLSTNAGVPNDKIVPAVKIIMNEYDRLRNETVSKDELNKAKDYLKGKTLMGLESSSAVASFVGDQAMLHNKAVDIQDIFKKIDHVTVTQVQNVAKEIFQNKKLNLAIIGPKGQEQELKKALRFTP